MGVTIREKIKDSGEYYIFINWKGYRKSKKIGRDLRLANEVAEKIKARLVLGQLPFEDQDRQMLPTFEKYARKWLKLPADRKPTTTELYEYTMVRHVFPEIGRLTLDKVTRPRLQTLFDYLATDGYAKSTIRIAKGPVSLVLDHAVEGGLIDKNPCKDLKTGGVAAKKPNDPLNEAEAERLLEQAKLYDDGEYYPIFLYALRTGKRIGEIRATKWEDIDFERRFVEVKRNIVRGKSYTPKGNRSRRVGLSPMVIKHLKKLHTQQRKDALQNRYPVPEFVFTEPGDRIMRLHLIRDALEKCLKAADLRRITIHDLRHSYAHIRLSRGHNLPDVSRSLGHADVKITVKTYGHLKHDDFQAEIDSLDTPHPNAPYTQPAGGKV
jgi:integrase